MDPIPADLVKAMLASQPKGQLDAFLKPAGAVTWPKPWIPLGAVKPAVWESPSDSEIHPQPITLTCNFSPFTFTEEARAAAQDHARRISDPQDLEDGLLAVQHDAMIASIQADCLAAHEAGVMAALGIKPPPQPEPLPRDLPA